MPLVGVGPQNQGKTGGSWKTGGLSYKISFQRSSTQKRVKKKTVRHPCIFGDL